jgi:hypothetical protein
MFTVWGHISSAIIVSGAAALPDGCAQSESTHWNFREDARACYFLAAVNRQRADNAFNTTDESWFRETEQRWLRLAQGYEFVAVLRGALRGN